MKGRIKGGEGQKRSSAHSEQGRCKICTCEGVKAKPLEKGQGTSQMPLSQLVSENQEEGLDKCGKIWYNVLQNDTLSH